MIAAARQIPAVVAAALLAALPTGSLAAGGENVCIPCHESLSGPLGDPVPLWKKSIHAANGVFCNDCHGGDPADPAEAMNPRRGFTGVPKERAIPRVCGRCHVGILDDYLKSGHGRALGAGGPTCVTCHGSHGIARATLELINEETCTRCHTYERAAMIREAMQQTEDYITTLDSLLTRYKSRGMDVGKEEKQLFSARNKYHRLFHEINVVKVGNESAGIRDELAVVDAGLGKISAIQRSRKLYGAGAALLSLLAALLLFLLQKTYDRAKE